jgi:flagellar protein FlaG
MADQVNPTGGLTPGTAQILQALTVPPSTKPPSLQPAASKPKAVEERDVAASTQEFEAAAKSVEAFLQQIPSFSDLQFMVDRDTGMFYFKVIDPDTKETIRQVPAEEIIAMAKKLRELNTPKNASGVLMDKEV